MLPTNSECFSAFCIRVSIIFPTCSLCPQQKRAYSAPWAWTCIIYSSYIIQVHADRHLLSAVPWISEDCLLWWNPTLQQWGGAVLLYLFPCQGVCAADAVPFKRSLTDSLEMMYFFKNLAFSEHAWAGRIWVRHPRTLFSGRWETIPHGHGVMPQGQRKGQLLLSFNLAYRAAVYLSWWNGPS